MAIYGIVLSDCLFSCSHIDLWSLAADTVYLSEKFKCNVVGIDLTEEYISIGEKLTEFVGLSDRVELRHGSALKIPYEDERFDIS